MQGPRRRLSNARERGYLDATCAANNALVQSHGLWCWRLKVPMVWFERRSPHSRYGVVHLDMLTTPNVLNTAGQQVLYGLGATEASSHQAIWDRVPRAQLASVGHAAYRAAVKSEHYRLNRQQLIQIDTRSPNPLTLVPRQAVSA